MTDGAFIALFIAVITFCLFIFLILNLINKRKPDLIKPSIIQQTRTDTKYQFNVHLILGICLTSYLISDGVYFICNIIILTFYDEFYVNSINLIPIAIIFIVYIIGQLNEFINSNLK